MTQRIIPKIEVQTKNASITRGADFIMVRAETDYILHREFKELFNRVEELAKEAPVEKVIFDKTFLTVFNQESMEWYYTQWKPRVLKLGITKHYKILPKDRAFVKMVSLCKEKIYKAMPDELLQKIDIRYCNSLDEAMRL